MNFCNSIRDVHRYTKSWKCDITKAFPNFWIETKIEWTCWGWWCIDMLLILYQRLCIFYFTKIDSEYEGTVARAFKIRCVFLNQGNFVCIMLFPDCVFLCISMFCTRDYCQMHSCAFSVVIWNNVGVGQHNNR